MSQVWKTECQTPTDKLVLLALADNCNDEGFCWPSLQTICKKTDLAERTVRNCLRAMESKRPPWIITTQNPGHSSTYQLSIPTPAQDAPPYRNGQRGAPDAPRHVMPPTPAPDAPPGGHQMPPEPSVEASKNLSPTPQGDLFGENGSGKKAKEWKPTVLQLRLGKLFRRKPSTRWSFDELKAFKSIETPDEEDLRNLERYYFANWPEAKDYRRKDLLTVLNNFAGELDRARQFKEPTVL